MRLWHLLVIVTFWSCIYMKMYELANESLIPITLASSTKAKTSVEVDEPSDLTPDIHSYQIVVHICLTLFSLDNSKQVLWQTVKTYMIMRYFIRLCTVCSVKTLFRDRNTFYRLTGYPLKHKMDDSIRIVAICMG